MPTSKAKTTVVTPVTELATPLPVPRPTTNRQPRAKQSTVYVKAVHQIAKQTFTIHWIPNHSWLVRWVSCKLGPVSLVKIRDGGCMALHVSPGNNWQHHTNEVFWKLIDVKTLPSASWWQPTTSDLKWKQLTGRHIPHYYRPISVLDPKLIKRRCPPRSGQSPMLHPLPSQQAEDQQTHCPPQRHLHWPHQTKTKK